MNRSLSALAAAAALVGASSAAADTFSPAASSATFTGAVTVDGFVTLNCDMTVSYQSAVGGGDADLVSASLSGGYCTVFSPASLASNIDVHAPTTPGAAATQLKLRGMTLATCGPGTDIVVGWNAAVPATITIYSATAVGSCLIEGILYQDSGSAVTILR